LFAAFSVSAPAFGGTPVEITAGITIDQACICKVASSENGGSGPTVMLYGTSSGSGFDGWPVDYGNGTSPSEFRLLPGDQVWALSSGGSGSNLYVMIYSAGDN
jgi:hypothetical protein